MPQLASSTNTGLGALVLTVLLAGCGHGPPARAPASVARLTGQAREAGSALVNLERALRARDIDYACSRVYARSSFGSFANCKRLQGRFVADFKEFSLSVQRMTMSGRNAMADTLVSFRSFRHHLHVVNESVPFPLVHEAGGWRVEANFDRIPAVGPPHDGVGG